MRGQNKSTQANPDFAVDFVSRYSIEKLFKYAIAGEYSESRILQLSTLRSKGRPKKNSSVHDFSQLPIDKKLCVVGKQLDAFIDHSERSNERTNVRNHVG